MQTTEIIVYLTVAIILGIMVIGFIGDLTYSDLYDDIATLFTGKRDVSFKEITEDEFVSYMFTVWSECGYGEKNTSVSYYVTGENSITKPMIFDTVKELALCNTLQSANQECGSGENVEVKPSQIPLPAVVNIYCNNTNSTLHITG